MIWLLAVGVGVVIGSWIVQEGQEQHDSKKDTVFLLVGLGLED